LTATGSDGISHNQFTQSRFAGTPTIRKSGGLKKVEVLANIAVVIASVVLCSALAKKFFFTSSTTQTRHRRKWFYKLTDANSGTNFDHDNDGSAERLAGTFLGTDDAFLALDRNGNGRIDNGAETFW
jgi:hypothetical protein